MAANGATTILPAGNTCNGSADDAVTGFVGRASPDVRSARPACGRSPSTRRARCTCVRTATTIDDALSGTVVFQ